MRRIDPDVVEEELKHVPALEKVLIALQREVLNLKNMHAVRKP